MRDVADLLIRDVPPDVIADIDARAARLGLSRNEYLRRRLREEARPSARPVEVADFERLAELIADVANPDFEARAWS